MFNKQPESLTLVDSLHSVQDALDSMLFDRKPGFQIAPGVAPDMLVLDAIEMATQRHLPDYAIKRRATVSMSMDIQKDTITHIDSGNYGVSAHINYGLGKVSLALLRPEIPESKFNERSRAGKNQNIKDRHVEGWHTGELKDGMITVFSQGMNTGAYRIGRAAHSFVSAPGHKRAWSRHSSARDN